MILAIVLGNASWGSAQDSDASAPGADAGVPRREERQERQPFISRQGEKADNEQLGGEPSLTEGKAASESGPATQVDEEECDLDCLEAQLEGEKAQEEHSKRTLEVAAESGATNPETVTQPEESMGSEPSTTTLAEAEAEAPGARRLPTRLGPVRIRFGKGDDFLGIGFASQLEFNYLQDFEGAGLEKESTEVLRWRRLRLILSSSFVEGRIRSRFQINLTPSSFEVLDMWFAFTRFKFATFRIGQFKIPYDRYRAQSFAALTFIDWPPTARMFGSERQIGAEMLASGGFADLEYAFGIFSGVNARATFAVGLIEVYGNVPTNPSNLGDGEVLSEFHPELTGRFAKNFGNINTDTNSDELRSADLRHSLGAGISWDARPTPAEDLALRLQVEWLGKIRGVHINVVNYLAWFPPWEGGKILFGPVGLMAETGYRFNLTWEIALRYNIVYLTPWLRSDSRSYGQFQIMNASDPAQAMEQYGNNGDQTMSQRLALAGTSYVIGRSLKVVAEVAWETQLWTAGRRNGMGCGLQLQLVF